MKFKAIGSNSAKSVSYLLTDSLGESILIEAGCSAYDTYTYMNRDISGLQGVLISHGHYLQTRFLSEYLQRRRRVYAITEIIRELEDKSYCTIIESMHGFYCGGFNILPIRVLHEVPCIGFIIKHKECGAIAFSPNPSILNYIDNECKHIILECSDHVLEYEIPNFISDVTLVQSYHPSIGIGTIADIVREKFGIKVFVADSFIRDEIEFS